jgi:hypothetical protein
LHGLISLIAKVGVEEGVDLYQRDIITCTVPEAWLNDEIINAYLGLLIHYLRSFATDSGPPCPPLHGLISLIAKVGVEEGVEGMEERSIARSEAFAIRDIRPCNGGQGGPESVAKDC